MEVYDLRVFALSCSLMSLKVRFCFALTHDLLKQGNLPQKCYIVSMAYCKVGHFPQTQKGLNFKAFAAVVLTLSQIWRRRRRLFEESHMWNGLVHDCHTLVDSTRKWTFLNKKLIAKNIPLCGFKSHSCTVWQFWSFWDKFS